MKRRRWRWWKILGTLMLLACVGFFALVWYASSRLITPARRPLQDYHLEFLANPGAHGVRVESFKARTSDGFDTPCLLCEPLVSPATSAVKGAKVRSELQALGLTSEPWGTIKATLVLLHGHKGRKEDYLPVAERLCAVGFRRLLVDLPGHGEHPASFATFGHGEAGLPSEVLQAASRRFQFKPAPAGLFGISQGGAIAIQAAARPEDGWFAVAELSGVASLQDVIRDQAVQYFGPLREPAEALVYALVKHRAGFEPSAIRPIDAASRLTSMPVLIGHGDADAFIQPHHAQALFQAVPSTRKQFLNVPGAGHGNVLVTPAQVYATLGRFFLEALPP
jgi:pimeloyl-ACP methyl ester carboxylesterase